MKIVPVEGVMMVKAVLYDMDGTLVDTERLGLIAWARAAEQEGVDLPVEVCRQFIGRNLPGVMGILEDHFGSKEFSEKIYDLHRSIELDMYGTELVTKEGARESLEAMRDAGYAIGLVTSSRRSSAERNMKRFELMDFFDCITSGEETHNGKPAPDIYLLAAQKMGVEPASCVVVEDSPNGARSGIAAGMHVMMIPDMVEVAPELAEQCDALLDSLLELPAAVKKL